MLFRNIYSVVLISGLLAACAGDEDLPIQAEPSPGPHGQADNYAADADGALVVSEEEGVLANDGNAGPVDAEFIDGPQHAATFQLNSDGSFSYQYNGDPAADGDSFRYRVHDGEGETTGPITVGISLSAYQIDNVAPVAGDDSALVAEDQSVVATVLSNDSDANSNLDSSSVVITSQPANGSAEVLEDGSIRYQPNANFNGSDSFGYQVSDFAGAASNEATVAVQIESINDLPAGNEDSFSTNNQTVLSRQLECEDVDHSVHHYVLVDEMSAAEGSVVIEDDGQFEFTPNNLFGGTTEFTFSCEDGEGAVSSDAMITITVNNPAPTGVADAFSVAEGGSNNSFNVLANDSDEFGDELTASLEQSPQHANSFALDADGSVSYQHNDSETSSDSFSYRVSDGNSQSDPITVSITVNAVDDPPQLALGPPVDDYFIYYIAGDGFQQVLPGNAAIDDDNNEISSCTFSSNTRPDGLSEQLTLVESGPITVEDQSESDGFLLVASGSSDVDSYNVVLRSLSYNNPALNPTAAERYIDVQCQDGSGQATPVRTLTISVQLTEARRISVSSAPENAQGSDLSDTPMVSGNGRYAVFLSDSVELSDHAYSSDNPFQVFRRDIVSGETLLISHSNNAVAEHRAFHPCINYDGSKIGFSIRPDGLGIGATSTAQLIVADMAEPDAPSFTIVSDGFISSSTDQRCQFSGSDHVVFVGRRGNTSVDAIGDPPSGTSNHVYIRDLSTGSLSAASSSAYSSADAGSISANGRYVAFVANIPTETGSVRRVILRDMVDNTFGNLTPNANSAVYRTHISADGSRVVFESSATNFVENDTNGFPDIFVVDVESGAIGRVNSRSDGSSPNNATGIANQVHEDARGEPRLSGDGRYVIYTASQDDIDPESLDNVGDTIFVKTLPAQITDDGLTGEIRKIDPRETQSNTGDIATLADIDFFGDRIAFESSRPDIVPEDSNQRSDVFEMNNPLYTLVPDQDTDDDGLSDQEERRLSFTHPGVMDSDRDGLSDLEEVQFGESDEVDNAYNPGLNTDPNNPDTDGDGELDGDEVDAGTNPLVAD